MSKYFWEINPEEAIAIDSETGGLNPYVPENRAFLLTWTTIEGDFAAPIMPPKEMEEAFGPTIERPELNLSLIHI